MTDIQINFISPYLSPGKMIFPIKSALILYDPYSTLGALELSILVLTTMWAFPIFLDPHAMTTSLGESLCVIL